MAPLPRISTISKVSIVDSFDKRRVYFTYPSHSSTMGWKGKMYAYCFTGTGNNVVQEAKWQGTEVTATDDGNGNKLKDDIGQEIFYHDVPGQYEMIVFNIDLNLCFISFLLFYTDIIIGLYILSLAS